MTLKSSVDVIENISDETMQQLLLLELVHEVVESGRTHLRVARHLLSQPTNVRLQPKSTDELTLFIQKLCKKAELVISEPVDGATEEVRTLAKTFLESQEGLVSSAILFGRSYLASYLERLSKS